MVTKKLKTAVWNGTSPNMEALNAQLANIQKRKQEILQIKDALEHEEMDIERDIERLEEERLKLSQKLSPSDERHLRSELTALGELLELPAVILATLEIMSIPPTQDPRDLYKIRIDTHVTYDSGVTGLSVRARIITVCPEVEAVVRSLFVQEGHVRDSDKCTHMWEKNWDYHTWIRLTSHEALS